MAEYSKTQIIHVHVASGKYEFMIQYVRKQPDLLWNEIKQIRLIHVHVYLTYFFNCSFLISSMA